ncbi:DMT family transporter [Nisaea acidiphila]|uniref:DMT family transporter n=1 Tax=Nisaea acidiphila TaxID=1862145 RepID=A0A9J7ARC1_9PROT|nr:DMT family transporter [Nisaea acidiphila]UUX49791.1 DMT family transporter [Nisaea acidiphila]
MASDQRERSTVFQIWHRAPENVKGCIWLVLASLFFAVMTAAIKDVGQRIPVWEILFIRQLCVIAILGPQLYRSFPAGFKTERLHLHGLRVGFSLLAMTTGFTAVIYMPLAQVTAISFARTLFITLLAVLILKEVVDLKRWGATVFGFLGVLIVLQPSLDGIDFYAGLAMASAMSLAVVMVLTRIMAKTESPMAIMTYQSFGLTIAFAIPAILMWQTPTAWELLTMVVTGVLMTLAQYSNIKAYKHGEASAVQPMEYTRLVFAGLIGVMFFQEVPSLWTVAGSIVIFVGAIYSVREMRRDARMAQE